MKNSKLLGVICFIFAFSTVSVAQSLHVQAGLNLANSLIKMQGETAEDLNSRLGFQFGVLGEFGLGSEMFKLETGLLFSQKGYTYDEDIPLFGSATGNITLNYLELPVNAKVYFGGETTKFFAAAGPYLGYAISGTIKQEFANMTEEEDIEFGNDADEDNLKAFDYGLNFGVGVEYMDFQLRGTYGLGLANLIIEPEDGFSWQNRVIQIQLSYRILN